LKINKINEQKLDTIKMFSGKPKTYSLCRLSMVTSIVCGLEFCASVALSYVPSMLLKAGLKEQEMTLIMGLGPFFGFFICPLIGKLSDNCSSKYGRRKPFIFVLSLTILFSLSMIYYSQILMFSYNTSVLSVCLLVFACVLLDFSSQASFNPIESLLLDMCQGTDREHSCFTVYSFMNSLGGCLGYLITGISWNNVIKMFIKQPTEQLNETLEAAKRELDQERSVFAILGVLYAVFALTTLFYAQDSVKQVENDSLESQNGNDVTHTSQTSPKSLIIHFFRNIKK
jgi:Na+/melibiose symporter-like transporter